MKFQRGDKIRVIDTDFLQDTRYVRGTIYTCAGPDPANNYALFVEEIKPALYGVHETRFELVTSVCPVITNYTVGAHSQIMKCECGVDSIGGGRHSSYCPKA